MLPPSHHHLLLLVDAPTVKDFPPSLSSLKIQRYFFPAPTTLARKTALLSNPPSTSSAPAKGLKHALIQFSNTSQKNKRIASSVCGLVGLFGMPPAEEPPPPVMLSLLLPSPVMDEPARARRDEFRDVPAEPVVLVLVLVEEGFEV